MRLIEILRVLTQDPKKIKEETFGKPLMLNHCLIQQETIAFLNTGLGTRCNPTSIKEIETLLRQWGCK